MTPRQLIVFLNALDVGEVALLSDKLDQARVACIELGQPDLADHLIEARSALDDMDLKRYRKRVHNVLAKLGHLQ